MQKQDKRKVFALMAKKFETNEFKEYFLDMCEEIPDYIFYIPSSTSGQFHNKTQCQKHGQLFHEFMFFRILDYKLGLEWNKNIYNTPEVRDAMRCVPVFHDAIKCGLNGSMYTVPKHPLLAAEWVRTTKVEHDIPNDYKEMIAGMCETHSGEFNTGRTGKEILPKPRNEMEFMIHECDYLSSRADLDMVVPASLVAILEEVTGETPETYVMPFGKYKGMTLAEVAQSHPSYITWAKENMTDHEPLNTLLQSM